MHYLTEEQIDHYNRDGYLIVRGFYNEAEMEQIIAWVEEVQGYPDAPGKYQRYYEESLVEISKRMLNRLENFAPYHTGFHTLFVASRLEQAVSDLFGEPAVLFKEKINFKLPGGGGFEPHQDHQAGWGDYVEFCISALVSIDEAAEENGCLEITAGHHHRGMFKEWTPLTEQDMQDMKFVSYPTKPGDVIFFDSFTPHRSKPNLSGKPRRLMYVTYNRLSEGDHRIQYYHDKWKAYPQDCEREPGKEYVYRV
jgi:ectoine hydroxylase-related dioxygenase (phytanoyl-CoA dioxygenase family)